MQTVEVDTTRGDAKVAKITDDDFRDAVTSLYTDAGTYVDNLNAELAEMEDADVVVDSSVTGIRRTT